MNENFQITHDRLITLENRTAMMEKAIILVLKDFKAQINNTNDRLIAQYWMMTGAHDRYNRLFRQTHKTFQIHHLALNHRLYNYTSQYTTKNPQTIYQIRIGTG